MHLQTGCAQLWAPDFDVQIGEILTIQEKCSDQQFCAYFEVEKYIKK